MGSDILWSNTVVLKQNPSQNPLTSIIYIISFSYDFLQFSLPHEFWKNFNMIQ